MCGIFGVINGKKPKQFRYTAFAGLGILNDSRGGDSCGIFIDGKYEYGVNDKKLFKDFMLNSKLLEETRGTEVKVAIGHCRKASVGAVNEANAQPVILKDADGNPEFVLIHNGTIKNHEELAKKYIPEIDVTNMTDSQIMARIFYKSGYSVLSEYYGGGVFFIVDYRGRKNPKCYFFQGYSKSTTYAKDATQERPFYFVNRDNTLMFSSIYEMLQAACPEATVFQPAEDNILYSFSEKGLVQEGTYSRENVAQQMPFTSTSYVTSGYRGTYYQSQSTPVNTAGKISAALNPTTPTKTTTTTVTTTAASTSSGVPSGVSQFVNGNNLKMPQVPKCQKISNATHPNAKVVYDIRTNRYTVNQIPLHGVYAISQYGVLVDTTNAYAKVNVVWFFEGIPMNLQKGEYLFARFNALCQDFKVNPSTFTMMFTDIVRWFSADRLYRDTETNVLMVATSPKEHKPFTGVFMQLCEAYGTKFENGVEIDHSFCPVGNDTKSFLENENQGANRITTEDNLQKIIRKLCKEVQKA